MGEAMAEVLPAKQSVRSQHGRAAALMKELLGKNLATSSIFETNCGFTG
jgi:hypothetical protein